MNCGKAKNVILFVGDGMGIQTITMARIFKGQKMGKNGEETEMVWDSFPTTGLSKVRFHPIPNLIKLNNKYTYTLHYDLQVQHFYDTFAFLSFNLQSNKDLFLI